MVLECPIERLWIFTFGGLVVLLRFYNKNAEIITQWPTQVSVEAMKLVAMMLKYHQEYGRRIIVHKNLICYIPEESEYIPLARFKNKTYAVSIAGFLRKLANALKGLPEDSLLLGEIAVKILQKHFRFTFSKIKRV